MGRHTSPKIQVEISKGPPHGVASRPRRRVTCGNLPVIFPNSFSISSPKTSPPNKIWSTSSFCAESPTTWKCTRMPGGSPTRRFAQQAVGGGHSISYELPTAQTTIHVRSTPFQGYFALSRSSARSCMLSLRRCLSFRSLSQGSTVRFYLFARQCTHIRLQKRVH